MAASGAARYHRPVVAILAEHESTSNRRFEVALDDGARVEAVLYRRDTLCISCQVGCAVACPFCASGANGLSRPLTLDELTGQVEAVEALGARLARVTVSGVGEPLHNAKNVMGFIAWARRRGIGPSLTTSGGPVARLSEVLPLAHNGVTVSVHAGTEPTRARLVPNGPSLAELFGTLERDVPRLSGSRRKKLALAYLLIEGANDTDAEVDAFLDRAAPLGLMTHLYAYNPVPTSSHRRVSDARYAAIYERMTRRGLRVRMSSKARVEENGGCGTLIAVRKARRGLPAVTSP